MSMPAEARQNGGRRPVHLPNEVIHRIVEAVAALFGSASIDVDDESSIENDDARKFLKKDTVRFLLNFSVCSRRFREIASLFLYGDILLPRLTYGKLTFPSPRDIMPMALLVRTLVENPRLRPLVRDLECDIFLRFPAYYPLDENPYQHLEQEEWRLIQTHGQPTRPLSRTDSMVLRYAGWPPPVYNSDAREHCLLALLLLVPNIRSLAITPLLSRKWAAAVSSLNPALTAKQRGLMKMHAGGVARGSHTTPQDHNEGKYPFLHTLIKALFHDTNPFYKKVFQKLETVRLICPPPIQRKNVPHDDLIAHWGGRFTIQFNSCFGLLQSPNITRLRLDSLDRPDTNQLPLQPLFAGSSIRELIVTGPQPVKALERLHDLWPLTSLTVHCSADSHRRESSSAVQYVEDFDRMLTNMAKTLKYLNICEGITYADPTPLTVIRDLENLEDLCIPSRLLCKADLLQKGTLAEVLPPKLKRLGIMIHWNPHAAIVLRPLIPVANNIHLAPRPEPVHAEVPYADRYVEWVSKWVVEFAHTCKNTHPTLTSVSILRHLRAPKSADGRRGKKFTGEVVPDAEEIDELFRAAGVAYRGRYFVQGSSAADGFECY